MKSSASRTRTFDRIRSLTLVQRTSTRTSSSTSACPPARVFDSFGPEHAARLAADAVAAAEQAVLEALAEGAGVDIDPAAVPRRWHDTPLAAGNPGDPHDAALDAMREAIADQAALDLMGEMVVHGVCRADNTCG